MIILTMHKKIRIWSGQASEIFCIRDGCEEFSTPDKISSVTFHHKTLQNIFFFFVGVIVNIYIVVIHGFA